MVGIGGCGGYVLTEGNLYEKGDIEGGISGAAGRYLC